MQHNGVCFRACTNEGSVELSDVAGITCCWQDYVLDVFGTELEMMKAEGDLHLYGLDKPETLGDLKQGEYIYQIPVHFNHMIILTRSEQRSSKELQISCVKTST